jgi:hypothetical protein
MTLNTRSNYFFALSTLLLAVLVSSCALTRTETDYYTIVVRDTTFREDVRNVPGSADDNGVVFPSSRTTDIRHYTMTYDSTYDRKYPNFMRMGGLELAGFVLTSSRNGVGPGLLGAYGVADSSTIKGVGSVINPRSTTINSFFKGNLFRLLPYEARLRWFDDAADWTYGTSLFEMINRNEDEGFTSYPFMNIYIRKRFYLRERIPYIFISPFFGVGAIPSAYTNFGAELTLGSYGGFNLRGYLGMAAGFNWNFGGKKAAIAAHMPTKAFGFPYFGLGVSTLDFVNRPEETEREWKDYVHSSIEVSILELQLLHAFADYTNAFDTVLAALPFTGGTVRIGTAHYPVALLDSNFFVGTTLIQYMALGFEQASFSVLPLRAGYRTHLIAEDLSFEPFLELNYYPSQYVNVGARLRLNTFKDMNFGFVVGYANGSSGAFLPNSFVQEGSPIGSSFSSVYAGITLGLGSRIYTPDFVWRSKASEH